MSIFKINEELVNGIPYIHHWDSVVVKILHLRDQFFFLCFYSFLKHILNVVLDCFCASLRYAVVFLCSDNAFYAFLQIVRMIKKRSWPYDLGCQFNLQETLHLVMKGWDDFLTLFYTVVWFFTKAVMADPHWTQIKDTEARGNQNCPNSELCLFVELHANQLS